MSPLEQNIINLLPTLSDEAKRKARLVLGENPSFTQKNEKISDEEVRLALYKTLKI